MCKLLKVKEGLHELEDVDVTEKEKFNVFLDFAQVIPESAEMHKIVDYQGHIFCVPSNACIPYIGV